MPSFNLPTLAEINARIAELKAEIEVLEKLKTIVQPGKVSKYFAGSRTGRDAGHDITFYPESKEVFCTCPAGANGKTCWASKVVSAYGSKPGKSITWYDPDYYTYRTIAAQNV